MNFLALNILKTLDLCKDVKNKVAQLLNIELINNLNKQQQENFDTYKRITTLKNINERNFYKPNIRFSIITPCYNIEKYIEKLIISILNQTLLLENIQLILVNDGSSDNTLEIIQKYAAIYSHITVIDLKENMGVSEARNKALEAVENEFVLFIDGDDVINEIFFEELSKLIEAQQDLDIIFYNRITYNLNNNNTDCHNANVWSELTESYAIKIDKNFPIAIMSMTLFVLRKSDIETLNLRFSKDINYGEDTHFANKYLVYVFSKKRYINAYFAHNSIYYYVVRTDGSSATNNFAHNEMFFNINDSYLDTLQYSKSLNNNYELGFVKALITQQIFNMFRAFIDNKKFLQATNGYSQDLLHSFISQLKVLSLSAYPLSDDRYKALGLGYELSYKNLFTNIKRDNLERLNLISFNKLDNVVVLMFCGVQEKYNINFFINSENINVAHTTRRSVVFLTETCYFEHYYYLKLPSNGLLTATLNDAYLMFDVWFPHSSNLFNKQHIGVEYIKQIFTPNIVIPNSVFDLAKVKFIRTLIGSSLSSNYQDCYIFIDRLDSAAHNAEFLYEYTRQNTNKNIFFFLNRDSQDWQRLKDKNFNLIAVGSLESKIALACARYLISSFEVGWLLNNSLPKQQYGDFYNFEFVFLSHGVDINALPNYYLSQNNKTLNNLRYVITSSEQEYISTTKGNWYSSLSDYEVKLTGMPIHDKLFNIKLENKARDVLLISPTWRAWLEKRQANKMVINEEQLFKSSFYRYYQALLSSDYLQDYCANNNLKLIFNVHPRFADYFKQHAQNDFVFKSSLSNTSYLELIAKTKIFITDYSSAALDVAYIKDIPIINYKFDEREFFMKHTGCISWYTEANSAGISCYTEAELFKALEQIRDNDFKPLLAQQQNIDNIFKYHDDKNCERILQLLETKA